MFQVFVFNFLLNSRCKGLEVREGTVSLGNCKLCNEVEGSWFRVW